MCRRLRPVDCAVVGAVDDAVGCAVGLCGFVVAWVMRIKKNKK